MSTSKHIEKICIAAILISLVLTLCIVTAVKKGMIWSDNNLGYENRIFNTDQVHTLDIVMNDWDSFIENCESEEYSACTVVIDGEKIGNVGIRAKGNTSLSSVKSMDSSRYSFKIEFDQYEDGKSYYGLDKLCLNNLIQDNTMMKDYLAYQMMAEFGVDSPLCSYVYITVNGEDWGLYLAVEGIEDSFLNRNYGSDSGELYKPDTIGFGGGKGNGKDFDMKNFETEELNDAVDADSDSSSENAFQPGEMPQMPAGFTAGEMPEGFTAGEMPEGFDAGEMPQMPAGFTASEMPEGFNAGEIFNQMGGFSGMGSDDVKLKYIDDDADSYSTIFDSAKTDISNKDKTRLIEALKNLSNYENLENTLDMEEVLRYFVVHNFVVNGDSYTGSMIHNYYLHEKDGKLGMIPWDYNLAFGTFMGGDASSSVNASIDGLVSNGDVNDRPMFGWIFSDEEYTQMYHTLYSEFVSEWIEEGKLEEMIASTAEMISPYVEKDPTKFCTVEEFNAGIEAISKFVSLRGEAVKNQLSGDTTKVDTDGLNTSDMGSMGGSMGNGKAFDRPEQSGNASDRPEQSGNASDRPEQSGNASDRPEQGGNAPDKPGQGGNQNFEKGDQNAPTDRTFPQMNPPGEEGSFPTDVNFQVDGGTNRNTDLVNWAWIAIASLILGVGIIIAKKTR